MNTREIKKLKSDRGVSLSVALLFFLVCAILASMLIAAATAANGRAASVIESRQDDSAAVSGARLIADQLQKDVVIIVETAKIDQTGTTINDTTYYESQDSADAEEKTSLADFDKNVTKQADSSVLSASIQTMYSRYLTQISDKSKAFSNGSLEKMGSVSTLEPVQNDMQISVDSEADLTAYAVYTLNTDLSIDIRVSRNKAVCYVHCTPVITTNIAYEAIEEGNPDAGQNAVKTTIVSFAKASVSRS